MKATQSYRRRRRVAHSHQWWWPIHVVGDQLKAMKRQEESSTYKLPDIFHQAVDRRQDWSPAPPVVRVEWRRRMCEWAFHIVDLCQFSRETVDIAMSYLDRFVSTYRQCAAAREALHDRRQYQLAAMTGLYLAMKLHEPVEMEPAVLAEISRGEYVISDILEMECVMLEALQWRVHGPTRLTFALCFLALLPQPRRKPPISMERLLEMIHFQTELATADYYFTTLPPSTVGLACVLNALETWAAGSGRGLDTNVREAFEFQTLRVAGMDPFAPEVQEAQAQLVRAAAAASCNTFLGQPFSPTTNVGRRVSTTHDSEKEDHPTEHLDYYPYNKKRWSSPLCVSQTPVEQ